MGHSPKLPKFKWGFYSRKRLKKGFQIYNFQLSKIVSIYVRLSLKVIFKILWIFHWNVRCYGNLLYLEHYITVQTLESHNQGVREKAQVFDTLNFFGKGLTQIGTDVQLLWQLLINKWGWNLFQSHSIISISDVKILHCRLIIFWFLK